MNEKQRPRGRAIEAGSAAACPVRAAERNVACFIVFRIFFTARFYYPVYALLFLDFGLTLGEFGILNAIWAATIVLCEVPSGAIADAIGRRTLLVGAGALMILEMGVLLVAPVGGGGVLFWLFALNRVLSGLAEAAASGADEALAYDSLQAAGIEDRWGHVVERVQRRASVAFFFAMSIGAAVYDPGVINSLVELAGIPLRVDQSQVVKLPVFLTFLSGLVVLGAALRMVERGGSTHGGAGAVTVHAWRRTMAAVRWVWATPVAFGIILAVMALDNIVRQFLTLTSEYWRVIDLPIASYGLLGSGMALTGLIVPRIARLMAERHSPGRNFLFTCGLVFAGLCGLAAAVPLWGIVPAMLLFGAMHFTGYFVSRYLNEAAPSGMRATVLSLKGLSINVAYGAVSLLYSGLIVLIGRGAGADAGIPPGERQGAVFVESLGWFPWYFLATVALVFVVRRMRFGGWSGVESPSGGATTR